MNLCVSDQLNEYEILKQKSVSFGNDCVVVRLMDVVREISEILGIDVKDVEVQMHLSTLELCDIGRISGLMTRFGEDACPSVLDIALSSHTKSSLSEFSYSGLHVPFCFDKDVEEYETICKDSAYEYMNHIILAIPFKYFTTLGENDWYSSYVFIQAVINCQNKESAYSHRRLRVK